MQAGYAARLYELERGDVASGTDDVFKAITQVIKALIFQEHSFEGRDEGRALFYSVVVYDGLDGIWTLKGAPEPDLANAELRKRNLYGLRYAYRDMNNSNVREEWFVIDFVHWDMLQELLTDIHKDRKSLINGMQFHLRT